MKNDYFQGYYTWTKGEMEQGKWMVAVALLLVPVLILLVKNSNVLLRGMALPLFLLFAANIGYGGYLLLNRGQSQVVEKNELYSQLPIEEALKKESQKLKKDNSVFLILKKTWITLIIVSLILFLLTEGHYKGVALGFAITFMSLLTIDSLLHHRLLEYLASIDLKIMSLSK